MKFVQRYQSHDNEVVLLSLSLTLNKFHTFFWCFCFGFKRVNVGWEFWFNFFLSHFTVLPKLYYESFLFFLRRGLYFCVDSQSSVQVGFEYNAGKLRITEGNNFYSVPLTGHPSVSSSFFNVFLDINSSSH